MSGGFQVPTSDGTVLRPRLASSWADRLMLLTCSLAPQGASRILEGLSPKVEPKLVGKIQEFLAAPSADRRARLSVTFGERRDADERLRVLSPILPRPLLGALREALPSYRRNLPGLAIAPSVVALPEPMRAWANRLALEALRSTPELTLRVG